VGPDDLESDTTHAGFIRRRKAERGAHKVRTGMTTTTQREGEKGKGGRKSPSTAEPSGALVY
jgi:hypothetical protein